MARLIVSCMVASLVGMLSGCERPEATYVVLEGEGSPTALHYEVEPEERKYERVHHERYKSERAKLERRNDDYTRRRKHYFPRK
ncbi:MAG: hypothetical protein KDD69_12500 [Bdellovibrionales bacterium]|nr:hypothetical protein [Bdellovibrionales bacterium]